MLKLFCTGDSLDVTSIMLVMACNSVQHYQVPRSTVQSLTWCSGTSFPFPPCLHLTLNQRMELDLDRFGTVRYVTFSLVESGVAEGTSNSNSGSIIRYLIVVDILIIVLAFELLTRTCWAHETDGIDRCKLSPDISNVSSSCGWASLHK